MAVGSAISWAAVHRLLPLVCLLGCSAASLESDLNSFRASVADVVGAAAAPRDRVDRNLPSRRERRLDTSELSMGGFDFLAIQGCPLGALVGERNSPMGRQMVPSRRLIYELRFVEAARECLPGLSAERAARLGERVATKERELPRHVWNAIWLGEELEAYLSTGGSPIPASRRDGGAPALRSVTARLSARAALRPEDGEAIEEALGALRHHPPAGPLWVRLDRVRAVLDDVATLLEPRAPTRCGPDDRALERLFASAYPPLQSAIADLDRRANAELTALDALFDASALPLDDVPEAMQRYRDAQLRPDGLWGSYRDAVARHAAAWTPTLRTCGALPGEG